MLLLLVGCQGMPERADQIQDEKDLALFLRQLGTRYENACVKLGQASWNSMVGQAEPELVDSARAELADLFGNPVYRDIINLWRFGKKSVKDPELQRQLVIWNRCYMGAALEFNEELQKLEQAVQEKEEAFQFRLEGKEVTRAELNRIIRMDPDSGRRRLAWEAFGELSGALESDMTNLLRARNEQSVFLGNDVGYGFYTLFAQAIEEEWLLDIVERLEVQTREPYRHFLNALKRDLNVEEIYPWDLPYAVRGVEPMADKYFSAEMAIPTLLDCLGSMGFADGKLPFEIRQGDISYGILDIAVKIPQDVRLIVSPNGGYHFYSALMAECGRCLYTSHIRVGNPIYKGYDWVMGASSSAYGGAMAELLADFTKEPAWLQRYTSLSGQEISAFRHARQALDIYSLRALMSSIVFEFQTYRNLDRNLDDVRRQLDQLFLMVDVPEGGSSRWASMTSLASEPVYNQNYLVAALIAAQVHETLRNEFGEKYMENPQVSRWLIEKLYTQGEGVPWRDRVRQATGKDLGIEAYIHGLKDESPRE